LKSKIHLDLGEGTKISISVMFHLCELFFVFTFNHTPNDFTDKQDMGLLKHEVETQKAILIPYGSINSIPMKPKQPTTSHRSLSLTHKDMHILLYCDFASQQLSGILPPKLQHG